LESELGDRVDHAGVEVFAGEVDDLGVGGEADARHDFVVGDDTDFAFGDGDDTVFDGFAGDGVDCCADEEDGVVLRGGGGLEVLGGGDCGEEGEGGEDFGGVFHGWVDLFGWECLWKWKRRPLLYGRGSLKRVSSWCGRRGGVGCSRSCRGRCC